MEQGERGLVRNTDGLSKIAGWRIYYADGTTIDSEWDSTPATGVVAVVVFGRDFVTKTKGNPVIGTYRQLYYEDESDAEDLDFPQYRFWRTQSGGFEAGYDSPPPRSRAKLGAGVGSPFDEIFTSIGRHTRWET